MIGTASTKAISSPASFFTSMVPFDLPSFCFLHAMHARSVLWFARFTPLFQVFVLEMLGFGRRVMSVSSVDKRECDVSPDQCDAGVSGLARDFGLLEVRPTPFVIELTEIAD